MYILNLAFHKSSWAHILTLTTHYRHPAVSDVYIKISGMAYHIAHEYAVK